MKSLLVVTVLLLPGTAWAQTPAAYEATLHGRVLSCYGHAYSLVELLDVATKNLYMVAQESGKELTPERQQVVAGMLASGTLNDQQQVLDVTERLEDCVTRAVARATPDAAATFAAAALREEVAVGVTMAEGFGSDFRQATTAIDRVLAAMNDPDLRTSTNSIFSSFGGRVAAVLIRVRMTADDLVAKTKLP